MATISGCVGAARESWLDRKGELVFKPYYWTIRQGEYATDILFRDATALAEIYPALVQHVMQHFHTEDVLRFLGRKARSINSGEVKSVLQRRYEGVRIKHWVHEKLDQDEQGSVLRIETTINNPKRFRVRRRLMSHGPLLTLSNRVMRRSGFTDDCERLEIALISRA